MLINKQLLNNAKHNIVYIYNIVTFDKCLRYIKLTLIIIDHAVHKYWHNA